MSWTHLCETAMGLTQLVANFTLVLRVLGYFIFKYNFHLKFPHEVGYNYRKSFDLQRLKHMNVSNKFSVNISWIWLNPII